MNKKYIGKTTGVFTIIELMPYKDADGHALYKGVCNNCGTERIARYYDLKMTTKCTHIGINGEVSSCNANWSNKRIKEIFNGMKQRCYNKKNKNYKWYGDKGVKVCDSWMKNPISFETWALQNGYSDTLTIDRIDENKDYSPDNCRWITDVLNTKYKSTTSNIDVNGELHTGRDWSRILNLGTNVINNYVRKYGLENTVEFIKRRIKNPNLRQQNKNQSIYDLYMN